MKIHIGKDPGSCFETVYCDKIERGDKVEYDINRFKEMMGDDIKSSPLCVKCWVNYVK